MDIFTEGSLFSSKKVLTELGLQYLTLFFLSDYRKDRWVRTPKPHELKHMKHALDIEERNMFYLRHPFLSAVSYETAISS